MAEVHKAAKVKGKQKVVDSEIVFGRREKPLFEGECYTDGACTNNGRQLAQAGYGVFFGEQDKRNVSERVPSNFP